VDNLTKPSLGGWIRIYNLTFLVGMAISGTVFWALNYVFPPPGLNEDTSFIGEAVTTMDGYEPEQTGIKVHDFDEKHTATSDVSV
jgi:nucleobase:cation symporter-1, NCS1 family